MKFSIFYFADACQTRANGLYYLLFQGARFADGNGFEAVWTPERHFHPFGGPYANPSVTGAAVASITSRVQVRAGSVVAPLHHPLRIAEEWSMVDNMSRGRVGIALASGWNATDFALQPEAYADRSRIVTETLAQLRALWAGEPAKVVDGKGNVQHVQIYPRPVQEELPVWITTAGNANTFVSAGRAGAGVLTHLINQDIDALADKIKLYRSAASGSASPGHVVVMLHTLLGLDRFAVHAMVREPMIEYLRSSLNLLATAHRPDADLDLAAMQEATNELLEQAFRRQFDDGGLFGTVEDGRTRADQLEAAGVDEIACLIDFGLPDAVVLDGLTYLKALKDSYHHESR